MSMCFPDLLINMVKVNQPSLHSFTLKQLQNGGGTKCLEKMVVLNAELSSTNNIWNYLFPSLCETQLFGLQYTSLLICWLDKQTTSWLVWLIQFPGCPLPVCQSTSSQKNQCFRSLIIKTCYPVQLRKRSHDSCHAAAGDVACCKRWDEYVSKRAAILPKALSVVLCWEIWLNHRLRSVWLAVCHCVFPPTSFFLRWVADISHESVFCIDVVALLFFLTHAACAIEMFLACFYVYNSIQFKIK